MLLNHEGPFHGTGGINRTTWGTKLLLTAVWASLVDCISLCHLLKVQHCCLSPNGCFNPPLAPHPSHPPPTRPPPMTKSMILQELKKLPHKPAAFINNLKLAMK